MTLSRHRHLDADTLSRLAGLRLRVESTVEGTLSGLHASPNFGASVEFAEHKEYAPGDDLRHLDWKAYGKFDRFYIKRFEDETELRAYLLLDASGSMGYGKPMSKLDYAAVLVGSLAFLLTRQGDQPALLAFHEQVEAYLPPRARSTHLNAFLRTIEELVPSGKTDVGLALKKLIEVMSHRSLVIVTSDLLEHGDETMKLLRHLRARGNTVVVFHVLHPDELSFPFSRLAVFESMEDDASILVDPGGVRKAYLAELDRFLTRMETSCREAEVAYWRVSLADPVERVLTQYLSSGRRRR